MPRSSLWVGSGSGCSSQEEKQVGTGAQGDWFVSQSLVMVDLKHERGASESLPREGNGTDQGLVMVFHF